MRERDYFSKDSFLKELTNCQISQKTRSIFYDFNEKISHF